MAIVMAPAVRTNRNKRNQNKKQTEELWQTWPLRSQNKFRILLKAIPYNRIHRHGGYLCTLISLNARIWVNTVDTPYGTISCLLFSPYILVLLVPVHVLTVDSTAFPNRRCRRKQPSDCNHENGTLAAVPHKQELVGVNRKRGRN